jgi:hypothetical protein
VIPVLLLAGFSDEAGMEQEFAVARRSLPAAYQALLSVDPSCRREAVQPVLKCGFIANCSSSERTRIYWVRVEGAQAQVGRLVDEPVGGAVELDRVGGTLNIETTNADGRKLNRRWLLQRDKPVLAEESEAEQLVCTPSDNIKEWGKIAPFLHRPQRIKNLLAHSVTLVRETLDCKNGVPGITKRKGLVVPIVNVLQLSPAPPTLDDPPSPALRLDYFRVRGERYEQGKRVRLFLQATYPMSPSTSPTDPRTGDRFEIWLPPPLMQPNCEDALNPERACQPPSNPPSRIIIGFTADKKLVVADEQGKALSDVAASSNGKVLAVDLSAQKYAALSSGIAITYTVQATRHVDGTADVHHGQYGALDTVDLIESPSYDLKVVPVKARER